MATGNSDDFQVIPTVYKHCEVCASRAFLIHKWGCWTPQLMALSSRRRGLVPLESR